MLVSAAWIAPAGFAAINCIAQTRLNGWDPVTTRDLLWEGGDWLLYGLLTPAVFGLSKRLPLTGPRLVRNAFLHFVLSLLFCVAWATSNHGFLRAHRRALVRLDAVRELTRDRAGVLTAVLRSGARVPISRRRSAAFMAAVRQAG